MAKLPFFVASAFRNLIWMFSQLRFWRRYGSRNGVETKINEDKPGPMPSRQNEDTAVDSQPTLIAYRVCPLPQMRLVRAPSARDWMDATSNHFANRCLPLLIANQAGWFILSSHTLRVTWTGGNEIASLQIEYLNGLPPYPAVSHFGYGILTWTLPYLFRTSHGYNLLVRGPSNWPKKGAYPLEGIVETDWCPATFTMNWKVILPNTPLTFEVDEPICMIVPQRRQELETFTPQCLEIRSAPEEWQRFEKWTSDRSRFLNELKVLDSEAVRQGWQKHYFQGKPEEGQAITGHQTRLQLRDFEHLNEIDV